MKKTTLILLSICFSFSLYAGEPVNYNQANSFVQLGYRAFAEKKYDEAISYFNKVESYVTAHPKHKEYFDHHYRDFSIIDLIKKRKSLGEILPEVNHKILVFYVSSTNTTYKGIKVNENFTKEMKKEAQLSQAVCKRYMETLSNGLITLIFDEMEIHSTLKNLIHYNSKDHGKENVITVHADIESIDPYPGKILLDNYNKYDTFVFYWAGEALKKGRNGRATAMGGELNFPLVPYITYGPPRGRIILGSPLVHRPGTLFHEIFHTLEHRYSIKPSHGFWTSNRHHFPGWKGNGEFDYYQFHFNETFKGLGYKNFEYIKSFPSHISGKDYNSIIEKSKNISLRKRKLGDSWYNKAVKYYHKNKKISEIYLLKVLSYNPYHAGALERLCSINHAKGKKDKAFDYIVRAYAVSPYDPDVCYWMGVQHYHKQKYEESVGFFTKAVTYDPGHENSWQYRGFVNYKLGRYDQTYRDYKKCLSISDKFKKFIVKFLSDKKKRGEKEAGELLRRLPL